MRVAYHPIYCHPLPDNHRFPMVKYDLLPKQLVHEGIIQEEDFFDPVAACEEEVLLVHSMQYWEALKHLTLDRKAQRKTGFPLSKELVEREVKIVGGTIGCVTHALTDGVSFNIAGGTHHAYEGHGEGFCLLNDIAISSKVALQKGWVKQVLVVDLDVHQGNGTAKIFEGVPEVYTLSFHGAKNYPLKKENSDYDVPLEDGCDDKIYLERLEKILSEVIDRVRPDFVHYQAGVDILASDKLGRLGLSIEGARLRDELFFRLMYEKGIPIVCTMGGGYSEDIRVIVDAHTNTYRVAKDLFF